MALERTTIDLRNKIGRALWLIVSLLFFRATPRNAHSYRLLWLKLFGAKIAGKCFVYASARIWAPWNLEMAEGSIIGDRTEIYNVARISLARGAIVSQGAFLCTASHDYCDESFPLTASAIELHEGAWVGADAFICPGVKLGELAIVGARSVVTKSIPACTIVAGNPAKKIGDRAPVTQLPGQVLVSGYKKG